MLEAAAGGGHVNVLQWLIGEQQAVPSERTMRAAARCGRLRVLKHLRAAGCPHDMAALYEQTEKADAGSEVQREWMRACISSDERAGVQATAREQAAEAKGDGE
eukprot:TRINITY_DN4534_c0_g2_i1.p5 TRINITY_DN4534_c0_g2~~TRINITY_DN4534_c0_g2_i1.p5  ORF type:complete len:104 (-),score=42.29 TRINITY_DN4534_c0_g2_i1:157-468(-)